MIRLGLLLLFYMIPSLILTRILIFVFPHISVFGLIVSCLLLFAALYRLYRKRKIKKALEAGEDSVTHKISWGPLIMLLIGTFVSSAAMHTINKADLYIDNGTDRDILFDVKNEEKVKVTAHSYKKLNVVKGNIEIMYESGTKKFSMPDNGNWIFNPENKNLYIKTSVQYASEEQLYSSLHDVPKENKERLHEMNIVTDEFFNAKTDYVFDAPKSITIERGSSKNVNKTVLLRAGDKHNVLFNDDDEYQTTEDHPVATDDTVTVTSGKKRKK